MPRIAIVLINNCGVGGAERRFGQVFEHLRQRNSEVFLIVNESLLMNLVQSDLLKDQEDGLVVLREPIGRLLARVFGYKTDAGQKRNLLFVLSKIDYVIGCVTVAWWVLRARPDVLHVVLGGGYVVLPLQLLGWAPPIIASIVGPTLRDTVGSPFGLRLYRLAVRRAALVDALSPSIASAVIQEGIEPQRIRVSAGSCVNTNRFRPASDKQPWVVFVGRLIPEKNPLLFVEACARVIQKVPEARFFILGDGPLKAQIQDVIVRHGLDSVFHPVEWRRDVQTILCQALIFTSLQRTDNYPSQALLEAMASGTAVVATDVGLTWKLVNDTVGVRVSGTPSAVADAVVELLRKPDRAVEMGLRGRELVAKEHSLDRYLDYLEKMYAGV